MQSSYPDIYSWFPIAQKSKELVKAMQDPQRHVAWFDKDWIVRYEYASWRPIDCWIAGSAIKPKSYEASANRLVKKIKNDVLAIPAKENGKVLGYVYWTII